MTANESAVRDLHLVQASHLSEWGVHTIAPTLTNKQTVHSKP